MGFLHSQNTKAIIVSFDEVYNSEEKKNQLFTKATLLHNISQNVYEVKQKQIDEKTESTGMTNVKTLSKVPYQAYFKDYNKQTVIRQIGKKNSMSLLTKLNGIKWNLLREEKTIAGMLCKKAIAKTNKGEVTAWYTEDLGVKGGPREYDGLPGLILYLENDYFIYKAMKIERKLEQNILPERDKTTTMQTLTELKKRVIKTTTSASKSH